MQAPLALHRMRGPTKEADLTYRSELDLRTLLWPAVHDPLPTLIRKQNLPRA